MSSNPIKAALKRGETVSGMWSATGSPDLAEAACRIGWRCIFVDNEHGVADLDRAVAIHRAVLSAGGDVILRVPDANATHLKLVLDRGFRSIMAPMINTPEEAEAFVAACRYPPRGRRGYAAPIVRASGYGTEPDYVETAHEELLLIAQIEDAAAVDRAGEIAAVEGIDVLLLGPNDLAGSLGLLEHLDDPKVMEACERMEKATLASGKWLGSIARPGRTPEELHACGCRLIAGPADIGLFLAGARASLPDHTFETAPLPVAEAAAKKPARRTRSKAAAKPAVAAGKPAAKRTTRTAARKGASDAATGAKQRRTPRKTDG